MKTLAEIRKGYDSGSYSVRELWSRIHEEALRLESMNIWIHLLTAEEIEPYLSYIENHDKEELPLWGIPFAIKDNIDLAGIPTTAGCAEYTYIPAENAYVVERLLRAGALPIGKTNMDQFATGLVGTRSPYGEVHNAYREEYISGGSSSGSAVAVAKDLAVFALGTDTAGSGRVPASLNHLVGWKPSVGAWSNRGVVPACESIDCVTVFTHTVEDAEYIDGIVRAYDETYRYSKRIAAVMEEDAQTIYLPKEEPVFYGDEAEYYRKKWQETVAYIKAHYPNIKTYDTKELSEAASILYDGPWVAERYAGLKEYLDDHADTLFPVTGEIICGAIKKTMTAVDLFQAMHRLAEIKQRVHALLKDSVLILPTNGGTFTRKQVDENPIATNSQMGLYTNHCNLLDLCAVDVPIGFADNNLPMGITLFAKSGMEGMAAKTGREISAGMTANDGNNFADNTKKRGDKTIETFQNGKEKSERMLRNSKKKLVGNNVEIGVCGLHMRGYALESQMLALGAVYDRTTTTSEEYKLYELATKPAKPGLMKVMTGGQKQEIEIWDMPKEKLGDFLSMIPSPLGLGKLSTAEGKEVIGFLCEEYAVAGAKDITATGGWRYRH
ncbi:MAG: allophanate hydrolase [Lachnospiraceae bacterium]|nr:allophanate hydrolase [Lachnospiraceae bacterium]